MRRNTEYYKLLKLLHPDLYSCIDVEQFKDIMSKKEIIEEEVVSLSSDIHFFSKI